MGTFYVGLEETPQLLAVFFCMGDAVRFLGLMPQAEEGIYYIDSVEGDN